MRARILLLCLAAAACGGDDGGAGGADAAGRDAAPPDAAPPDAAVDDGGATDAAGDDGAVVDAGTPDAAGDAAVLDAAIDAATDAAIDAAIDAATDAAIDAVPATADHHVHIQVSNTCVMTVSPTEITVPANQTAYLDWHNHSVDYPVDVWMSYGGGYLELAPGATWDEPIGHCSTPSVHDEYADISTACSSFRFLIHCR